MNGFFDEYPRFYSTSNTYPVPNRLNRRHRALIASNAAILRDASVLDIASHDGRWSFAAVKAGARRVIGIEARDHHLANARMAMKEYGIPEERYQFLKGDVHELLLTIPPESIDVVQCFGFFHETMRHT